MFIFQFNLEDLQHEQSLSRYDFVSYWYDQREHQTDPKLKAAEVWKWQ